MNRFRTLRGRLTALGIAGAAIAVAVPVIVFNILFASNLGADLDSRLRSQAAAASTTVTTSGGHVRVRESPTDGAIDTRVWIYAGHRALMRPRGEPEVQRAADALAGRARRFTTEGDRAVRLYALPVSYRGRQIGTVVAARSIDAYDHATDIALIASVVLAVVLLTAVSAMTWLAVGRALAPVAAMTRSAAEWSDRELDRRFGTEPRPDELARLARTFDDLLDRVAASLRHEQRLSAELSHELRTPLARITAEIDLLKQRERPAAERNEAYAAVLRSTDQMRRILETLMAAARAESQPGPRGRTDLGPALAGLAEDWGPSFAERGVALEVRPTANQIAVGVDPDVLERVIAPLLDNARRYARARVVIGAERTNGRARVTVRDDGEGLAPGDADRIFEPGVRGERDAGAPGAGLGLPLARRLARASGGDVAAGEDDGEAGALFEVELPT